MTQQIPSPAPRFIRLNAAADKTGMGKSTILAWEATGKFPRAVRLSATLRVWLETDVDAWVRDQHAKCTAAPSRSCDNHGDAE